MNKFVDAEKKTRGPNLNRAGAAHPWAKPSRWMPNRADLVVEEVAELGLMHAAAGLVNASAWLVYEAGVRRLQGSGGAGAATGRCSGAAASSLLVPRDEEEDWARASLCPSACRWRSGGACCRVGHGDEQRWGSCGEGRGGGLGRSLLEKLLLLFEQTERERCEVREKDREGEERDEAGPYCG